MIQNEKQYSSFNYKEYAKKMRAGLCDKHITHSNGDINHKYFLVKKGQYWSLEMQQALLSILETEGVGNWKNMQKGELKNTSEIELELRTCLTLGISEVNQYNGQKFTKKQIEQIRNNNIKHAKETNKLKYGIYML